MAGTAPQLQRILNQALEAADWFGAAHEAAGAARRPAVADPDERLARRADAARRGDAPGHAGRRRGRYELAHDS